MTQKRKFARAARDKDIRIAALKRERDAIKKESLMLWKAILQIDKLASAGIALLPASIKDITQKVIDKKAKG